MYYRGKGLFKVLIINLNKSISDKSSFIAFDITINIIFNSKDLFINNLINVL
jgi:hypothetical protein